MLTICTLSIDGVDLVSYKPDPDRVAYVATIPGDILDGLADAMGLPLNTGGRRWVSTQFGSSSTHHEATTVDENGSRVYRASCSFQMTRGGVFVDVVFKRVEVAPSLWD